MSQILSVWKMKHKSIDLNIYRLHKNNKMEYVESFYGHPVPVMLHNVEVEHCSQFLTHKPVFETVKRKFLGLIPYKTVIMKPLKEEPFYKMVKGSNVYYITQDDYVLLVEALSNKQKEPYKDAHRLIKSHEDFICQDWGEREISLEQLHKMGDRNLSLLNVFANATSSEIINNMKRGTT